MERELTLTTLILATCGPTVLLAGSVLPSDATAGHARDAEARCARRVWWPACAALVPLGAVLGWGLQEPDVTGEAIGPVVRTIALVFCALWLRALLRAARSWLSSNRSAGVARTTGLLRPRVFIAPTLTARLDDGELAAALGHEQAHARHRDPLRVWLAQWVTDLQWPLPAASQRLKEWRHALELARDDEARAHGIPGEDLASAILKAASLAVRGRSAEVALGDGDLLAERVARLMVPRREPPHRPRSKAAWVVLGAVVTAVLAGSAFGEAAFRSLPGVRH